MKKHVARLISLAALCCVSLSPAAHAEPGFPAHPIKLVVPASPGGEPDILARLVARHMSADLRQPIVVENKVGASGLIGVASVASAKADGYTIGIVYQAVLALSPHLIARKLFDPLTDIAPIGLISVSGNALMVPANSPITSYADLVARARSSPGKLSFGSWGEGSAGHISGRGHEEGRRCRYRAHPLQGLQRIRVGHAWWRNRRGLWRMGPDVDPGQRW
ncbi:tripartite tricarboxylate transporter substrate binding protein [Cupriavidus taiwanensis]|uniref:Bug family tripartite tricarboxylate transporter substrate binding protein n=1 Tax=Cupriavidus taiwanensis TaxID=164546 RepID=UPI0025416CF0|nr:tripartite tricarboxylate transporter substrate binding protein [Cupriavidus taiwanensis]MDK3023155.1 tripartite tricarboxylate transporter substrate binding protein [Cupriavidus taiwanensis]